MLKPIALAELNPLEQAKMLGNYTLFPSDLADLRQVRTFRTAMKNLDQPADHLNDDLLEKAVYATANLVRILYDLYGHPSGPDAPSLRMLPILEWILACLWEVRGDFGKADHWFDHALVDAHQLGTPKEWFGIYEARQRSSDRWWLQQTHTSKGLITYFWRTCQFIRLLPRKFAS